MKIGFVGNGFVKLTSVQITGFKKNARQVGCHKIDRHQTAFLERSAFHFQSIEFGEIQNAIVERDLKNKLVAHGKIHILNATIVENSGSKCHVIDFGSIKNTIGKRTINKCNGYKKTIRKIAIVEGATFKFFQIEMLFGKHYIKMCNIDKIFLHYGRFY